MGGFSADWLKRREPVDHRSRDAGLLRRLAEWCVGRESLHIVDLGCGTGSNARAMMPHLPVQQHWRLVDYDAGLLAVAEAKLLSHPERTVDFVRADFSRGVEPLLAPPCDLVTAAALFDLVSPEWLDGLAAALAARSLPLYTVLIYDGLMEWSLPHPLDEPLRASFNAHQRRDKGFGPAAGPQAGPHLAARLAEAGYEVMTASSPWLLGPEDQALLVTNAVGIANAAREMGDLPEAEIERWLDMRRREGRSCVIGHIDVLALPLDQA